MFIIPPNHEKATIRVFIAHEKVSLYFLVLHEKASLYLLVVAVKKSTLIFRQKNTACDTMISSHTTNGAL